MLFPPKTKLPSSKGPRNRMYDKAQLKPLASQDTMPLAKLEVKYDENRLTNLVYCRESSLSR